MLLVWRTVCTVRILRAVGAVVGAVCIAGIWYRAHIKTYDQIAILRLYVYVSSQGHSNTVGPGACQGSARLAGVVKKCPLLFSFQF